MHRGLAASLTPSLVALSAVRGRRDTTFARLNGHRIAPHTPSMARSALDLPWSAILSFFLSIFFSACLDYRSLVITYKINPDLSGSVRLQFNQVQSKETDLKKRAEEIGNFCITEYKEYAKDLMKQTDLNPYAVKILNRTPDSCDAEMDITFKLLESGLWILMQEFDYTLKKSGDRLDLIFSSNRISSDEEKTTYLFEIAGKVIAHNSTQVRGNTYQWKGSDLLKGGIRMSLAVIKH